MPKGCFSIAKALKRLMVHPKPLTYQGQTGAELVALSLVRRALEEGSKDAVAAVREIMQRMDGKVPDRIAGADGGAVSFTFTEATPPTDDDDDPAPPEAARVPSSD
jgi:hypothetical protein